MLQAHAYWRLKGLAVDLVIVNEDDSVYRQSVHDQIMSLIASGIEAQMLDKPGGIFVRRADQLSRGRSYAVAGGRANRAVGRERDAGRTMQRRAPARTRRPAPCPGAHPPDRTACAGADLAERDLIFFNGLGGFTPDGREYVITAATGPDHARAVGQRDRQSATSARSFRKAAAPTRGSRTATSSA